MLQSFDDRVDGILASHLGLRKDFSFLVVENGATKVGGRGSKSLLGCGWGHVAGGSVEHMQVELGLVY